MEKPKPVMTMTKYPPLPREKRLLREAMEQKERPPPPVLLKKKEKEEEGGGEKEKKEEGGELSFFDNIYWTFGLTKHMSIDSKLKQKKEAADELLKKTNEEIIKQKQNRQRLIDDYRRESGTLEKEIDALKRRIKKKAAPGVIKLSQKSIQFQLDAVKNIEMKIKLAEKEESRLNNLYNLVAGDVTISKKTEIGSEYAKKIKSLGLTTKDDNKIIREVQRLQDNLTLQQQGVAGDDELLNDEETRADEKISPELEEILRSCEIENLEGRMAKLDTNNRSPSPPSQPPLLDDDGDDDDDEEKVKLEVS